MQKSNGSSELIKVRPLSLDQQKLVSVEMRSDAFKVVMDLGSWIMKK